VLVQVNNCPCLHLLFRGRKLISPGSGNFRGLLELCAQSRVRPTWLVFSPISTVHTSSCSATEAPKVALQPRGVNSRVGFACKSMATLAHFATMARGITALNKQGPAYAGGGSESTCSLAAGSAVLRPRGKRGNYWRMA
jgi:hypothetical protein